jgi:hypothetical protein
MEKNKQNLNMINEQESHLEHAENEAKQLEEEER